MGGAEGAGTPRTGGRSDAVAGESVAGREGLGTPGAAIGGAGVGATLGGTGCLADGNPMTVCRGCAAEGAGGVGAGVAPVRAAGIAVDGRGVVIIGGRATAAEGGAGVGAGSGRATEGLLGGLLAQAEAAATGAWSAAGPRSMVISP